jgi:D-sedoheptulose 7-phosphate isomerase
MDNLSYITEYLNESLSVKEKLRASQAVLDKVSEAAEVIIKAYKTNRKVLLAGNGGSAADCQHIAAEFVSRFFYDRPGLPAIALTTDSSMLTAIGNDYGFMNLFSRQVEAQGVSGDVFIGISTSGNSENILKALKAASKKDIHTIAFCGEGGAIKDHADTAICIPSISTPYIQECHITVGHIICAIVEKTMFPRD